MRVPTSFIVILTLIASGCASKSELPLSPSAMGSSSVSIAKASDGDQTSLVFYRLPTGYTEPSVLAVGPDNAIWFSIFNGNETTHVLNNPAIGRLDQSGAITAYDVHIPGALPIVGAATNGRLWFGVAPGSGFSAPLAPTSLNKLGNISIDGAVTTYQLPPAVAAFRRNCCGVSDAKNNVLGPDGNIWFAMRPIDKIGRVSQTGDITEFSLSPNPTGTNDGLNFPNSIGVGVDGALWITDSYGDAITRMTTDGVVTNTFQTPPESEPWEIATGDDGALWFTEIGSAYEYGDSSQPGQIGRITTSGQLTSYPMPLHGALLMSIRRSSNGFVFTDIGTHSVGLIDYTGAVVEYPLSGPNIIGIAWAIQGPDGSYYFTDGDQNTIGKITLGKAAAIFPQSIDIAGVGNKQLVGIAMLGKAIHLMPQVDNKNVATVAPLNDFPMNFIVTATGLGSSTLRIVDPGTGKPVFAKITVTAATSAQSIRRRTVDPDTSSY